ncbi:MAG: M48 family metalloprotease [Proteobacteria bacterium]|jgi:predicted Zn-dependent protease|nr:M48 family metalloprotease [Pseudomonadota bacterium]
MNEKTLKEFEKHLDEWTSTPMGRRAFLASLGFLMAACATTKKSRFREGDNSGQKTSLSVADEKKMTQEVMPQMRKDYPLAQNTEFQNYISQVGRRIVAANQLEGNPYNYNFSVVDVNYVNAFALPAGTIMVTVPLLAMAESEAELAGVIGHEIGHVKARHTAERMDKAKREQSKSWKYALGGGVLGGVLGYGIGRLACPPADKDCLSKATELGATAGVGGGLLVQKYAFMANSREDEMEADRIGFRTSLAAGYDKDHVGRFYSKLLEMEKKSGGNKGALTSLSDALSTHPPSQERVNQMNQMSLSARNEARPVVSTKEFDRIRSLAENSKKS